MATELITGLGIFKSMFDIAKGLKDINDVTVRNAAVIELQEKILAAQAQQTALVERISELEKTVARFEAWESEKQRYQLTDYGAGTFAYVLKPDMAGGDPSHRICANCYQKREKSILQFQAEISGQDHYDCPSCGTKFQFGTPQPTPPRPREGGSWMAS